MSGPDVPPTGGDSNQASLSRSADDLPLQFTVHSLPGGPAGDPRKAVGRWMMFAVAMVCAAPVLSSYFTYYVVRPDSRRGFGELIELQRPLPDLQGRALDSTPVDLPSLKGQWLLVSVAGGRCNPLCENHLYLQRQLREGLGKNKDRLDWVWIVNDQAPVRDALLPALNQATVVRVDGQRLASWLRPAPGYALEDHLYVVDPQGHWMMRFPAGLNKENAGKAHRDLERLMRASSSWDQAGR